jgi:fermentation-respiration switch protein FrsA (DUF1100 family)
MKRWALLLSLAMWAGCAGHRAPDLDPHAVSVDRQITLNAHPMLVHLVDARQHPDGPLLVYATGDRGWAGKDLEVYRRLVSWGYPVAGFDAHEYVTHLGKNGSTTTPPQLAKDYEAIIAAARDALHLAPGMPVVLVGVSRGAGLAVIAGGQCGLRTTLSGIVAIGLTREEEYVRWYRRIGRHRATTMEMVEVYDYLPRLHQLPLTVIQSTRDNYLPAASARALFGDDTDNHRLIAIDAKNHSFGGARDHLYETLHEAVVSMADLKPYD